jgi:hypothetical protein
MFGDLAGLTAGYRNALAFLGGGCDGGGWVGPWVSVFPWVDGLGIGSVGLLGFVGLDFGVSHVEMNVPLYGFHSWR